MPVVWCHIVVDLQLMTWSRKTYRYDRHADEVTRFAPSLLNIGYLQPYEKGMNGKYGLTVGRLVCLSSVCSSTLQD